MSIIKPLSTLARFYAVSFLVLGFLWAILAVAQVEFINVIFFITAFVWHFALVTPGLKEKVMTNHHKLSFLAVSVRVNHYLQVFINLKRVPYASSFIRALSPILFTFLLFVLGGSGNIIFTLLGSLSYEILYIVLKKKTTIFQSNLLVRKDDLDIPPAIPNVEKTHE